MDPRVARTREKLQHALFALARERPLDDITIGDITEAAEVNRSTFYQHYGDKESLLADALGHAIDEVSATILPITVDPAMAMPPELTVYLDHVAQNAPLYRRVLGEKGSAIVAAGLSDRIEQIVRPALASTDELRLLAEVPLDVAAAGITGTAMGVITAWVLRDPLPPVDEAAGWLWSVLAGPGRDWMDRAGGPATDAAGSDGGTGGQR